MNKREEIRWAPFQSLFSTTKVIQEIEEQKSKQPKPILSEDEFIELEKKIREAIHTHSKVKVTYYYDGKIATKIGLMEAILPHSLQIYFQDHTSLYFEQIIQIDL